MSDEFHTVSAKRGDRAREIEALRARYRKHREALLSLAGDAPSELIAADYRRVIADIDVALAKLDDAAGVPLAAAASAAPPPPPAPAHPARRGTAEEPLRMKTQPGMRPLVTPAALDDDTGAYARSGGDSRRLIIIVAITVLALAAIAAFIWKPWRDDEPGGAVVEQPAAGTDTITSATIAEDGPVTRAPASAAQLTVSPDTMDFGIVRKGTRATRQYELVNNGDEPLSPDVARSTCRCLYYEYAPVIPPRGKETLTVTIDGAKAKAGPLLESVRVTSKSDPSVVVTFDVTATVR